MSRIRSCNFMLVLYPDDFNHIIAMDILKRDGYQFSAILHDKDVDKEGNLKKEHYHYVVCFPRQKDLSALSNELGIKANYIEPVRNRQYAERYHIHADDPDQFQYDPTCIFGPLADRVRAHVASGETEEDKVKSLLILLDSMPVPCTYRQFLVACCDANLYSVFRRMGAVLRHLMDEHNGLAGY